MCFNACSWNWCTWYAPWAFILELSLEISYLEFSIFGKPNLNFFYTFSIFSMPKSVIFKWFIINILNTSQLSSFQILNFQICLRLLTICLYFSLLYPGENTSCWFPHPNWLPKSTDWLTKSFFFFFFCTRSWLSDVTVCYSMQDRKSGCGNFIRSIGSYTPRAKTSKYNAWCYQDLEYQKDTYIINKLD